MFYFIDNLAGADPDLDLYLDPDPKKRFSGLGFRAQFFILGKPLRNKGGVQTEFCPIAFQPPHPQANERFVGTIFAENQ